MKTLPFKFLVGLTLLSMFPLGATFSFTPVSLASGPEAPPQVVPPQQSPPLPAENKRVAEAQVEHPPAPLAANDVVQLGPDVRTGDPIPDSAVKEAHELILSDRSLITSTSTTDETYVPIVPSDQSPAGDEGAQTPIQPLALVTIMSENFEGSFPSGAWSVFDNNGANYGEYYWDDDDYLPHSGGWSAWAANGGADGLDPQNYYYPNNMDSWMVYGPFDLSDANDAQLLFYYWNQSELNWDWFGWYASTNGSNFYGYHTSGNSGGWLYENFDLTNVPTIGDVTGYSSVWIAFIFTSNGSNVDDGPFVDDIVLQKNTISGQANITPYTPSGWDYPIVPSSVQGTHTVDNLYADLATYIDWAVINSGEADISETFYSCLYMDGSQLQCWYTDGLGQYYYTYVEDWVLNPTPMQGWHTLKIVADVYNDVTESNETDNEWQHDFYWDVYSAQPNLTPYTPSGWDYPMVPSSVQSTHTVDNLYAYQNTYIDWAVINNGGADISATFYTCLYFDGSEIQCWYTESLSQGWYAYVEDWILNLTPSSGWHTLRIVTDVYNDVAESNEADNIWEDDFYWNAASCGPYTQSDNLMIPDDGTWISRSIHLGERPENAIAGEVSVKYGVQHPAPEELEIRLVNEATGIAYDLRNHQAAAGGEVEETILDIEAYRGQPVGEDWQLELRDTQPGNAGTLDYVSVRVRYAPPPGAALYDASGDASGRPAMLRLSKEALDNARPVEDYDLKTGQAPASPETEQRQPSPTVWEAIATEDFEGVFPGSGWTLLDISDDGCDFLWDDDDHRPYNGSWAGWPANGGANGLDPASSNYPPNMNSWMIYGPMDLSDAIDADSWFYLWLQTEQNWDPLFFGVSSDGSSFNGIQWSGTADWTFHDVYYTDYVGDDTVWVAWVFQSNSTINYEGAWVDDITIWKDVGGPYDCGITPGTNMVAVDDSMMERDRSLPNWDVPFFNWDDPYEIRLKSRQFTPQSEISPELLQRLEAAAAGTPTYVLLQLEQIPSPGQRQALDDLGISLLRYIPQRAWIASIPTHSLIRLIDLELIRWIGELHLEDKMEPALTHGVFYPWAYDPGTGEIAVIVQFMADISINDGLPVVQAHAGKVHDRIKSINALVVWIDKDELPGLAAEDKIEWIEQAPAPYSPLNDCIREMIGVDTLHGAPYSLDGTGVDVLVYDAGTVAATHSAFTGRLTIGDTSGTHDHATHVAGTVGGDGTGSPTGRDLRGMAPNVDIISYGFEYDGTGIFLYTNPGDIEDDWGEARATHGADIGTASLGTNTAANGFPCEYEGDYGATSQLLDAIVRGSLGAPYIATWANGNERGSGRCGTTYYTTAPPANAKNPIQVGASNSNQDVITAFSSWGPSDDGRLKPIVSAPGCESQGEFFINSTLPPNTYGEQGYCGTSMATPAVAGVVALMLEQYRTTYSTSGEFMPSTAKAVLIQTAVDLGNTGPDYQSGYGRVDAVRAVDAIINGDFREGTLNSQGQVEVFEIVVAPGISALQASLAWDDYPATLGANQQLVNDLDLVLVGPDSTVYYPWTLDPDSPDTPATRSADHLNNQEQVVVNNPSAGVWTVRITATSLPQAPQSYSVVFPGAGTSPNKPSNPSPPDGATGVSINADLAWTGGDPDPGDTVTYDVYFEADDSTPDNLICSDVSTPACDPGTLAYSTHYYWYVVATDNHGASTTGSIWDFTTETIISPPGRATLISPAGVISDTTPTYTWNAVATSTWYRLWVDGPSGTVINTWYKAIDVCEGATCAVTPTTVLADGEHTWWVQTWNEAGYGPWSAGLSFWVGQLAPPGPAPLISPSGAISDPTPTYTWSAVDTASWYRLWVDDPLGNVINRWYRAVDICAGGTCAVAPIIVLGDGPHVWWVQTWNLAGSGPWSTPLNFYVGIPGAPGPATLIAPSGTIDDTTPSYTWGVVGTASWYRLLVEGPSGTVINQWYKASNVCDRSSGLCAATPSTVLEEGQHHWWVKTWNEYGSTWSSRMDFTVSLAGGAGVEPSAGLVPPGAYRLYLPLVFKPGEVEVEPPASTPPLNDEEGPPREEQPPGSPPPGAEVGDGPPLQELGPGAGPPPGAEGEGSPPIDSGSDRR